MRGFLAEDLLPFKNMASYIQRYRRNSIRLSFDVELGGYMYNISQCWWWNRHPMLGTVIFLVMFLAAVLAMTYCGGGGSPFHN
jgi:hypothetical protein